MFEYSSLTTLKTFNAKDGNFFIEVVYLFARFAFPRPSLGAWLPTHIPV